MFGMKMPNKRPNMASGSNRGYAVYNNWKESVIDYALYQVYSGKNLSKEDYIKMLNDNYAEDTEYLNKLIK
jgi:flagellum-specific peptidoglycan hydrolase FlgJ